MILWELQLLFGKVNRYSDIKSLACWIIRLFWVQFRIVFKLSVWCCFGCFGVLCVFGFFFCLFFIYLFMVNAGLLILKVVEGSFLVYFSNSKLYFLWFHRFNPWLIVFILKKLPIIIQVPEMFLWCSWCGTECRK